MFYPNSLEAAADSSPTYGHRPGQPARPKRLSSEPLNGSAAPAAVDPMGLPGGTAVDMLALMVRVNGTTTELAVSGEWDLARSPGVWDAIRGALERGPECVVLDLAGLSFIDTSGIHDVLELYKRCARENIHLVIIPGCAAVRRLFDTCGLSEALPFLSAAG